MFIIVLVFTIWISTKFIGPSNDIVQVLLAGFAAKSIH